MSISAIVFLASEIFKLVMNHLAAQGSLNTLTQAQAETMVQTLAAGLPSLLPTPEQLEAGTLPPPTAPPVTPAP
jgi:hypothetical protein